MMLSIAMLLAAPAATGWAAVPTAAGAAEVDLGRMVEEKTADGVVRRAVFRTFNPAIAAMRVERTIAVRCDRRDWRITRIKSEISGKVFRDEAVPPQPWQPLAAAAVVRDAAGMMCAATVGG